jgi:hypothetical protein
MTDAPPGSHGGTSKPSPDGKWNVDVWDGPISTGQEGARVRLNDGWISFETPLQGFDGRAKGTKVAWSPSGDRGIVHIQTDKSESHLVTIMPAKRLIQCQPVVSREVLLPYHEVALVWLALVAGALVGWMLRGRSS